MRPRQPDVRPLRTRRAAPLVLFLVLLVLIELAQLWVFTTMNRRIAATYDARQVENRLNESAVAHEDALERWANEAPRELLSALRRKIGWPSSTAPPPTIPPHLQPPPPLMEEKLTYDPLSARPVKLRPSTTMSTTEVPRASNQVGGTPIAALAGQGRAAEGKEEKEPTADSSPGLEFFAALEKFYDNLLVDDVKGNPEQPSRSFVDIEEDEGRGVAVPYNTSFVEDPLNWQACDPRNASFRLERDRRCQAYLGNLNNVRYIKAMSSHLLQGRTIKMRISYAHNNLQAIVKLSQRKFVYEAVSEYLAHTYDRALRFNRVPTTVYLPFPLDYLRAATSYSPLLSQWFHRAIVLYNYTNSRFETCIYPGDERRHSIIADDNGNVLCTLATAQLWVKDVHPALETFLGLPYEYDDNFANKYYVPGNEQFAETKRSRLRAIGELLDRSIFDFIIGNTDRGMNDHNNFVYGGCSRKTECRVRAPSSRIYGLAKYAYIDHGSSFHSHKEPLENPFTGVLDRIRICRFRRSTHAHLKAFQSRQRVNFPLYTHIDSLLPTSVYKVAHDSVLKKTQMRLDKVTHIIDACLARYPEEEVYSLPEYNKVRIAEEDETLDEDWNEPD